MAEVITAPDIVPVPSVLAPSAPEVEVAAPSTVGLPLPKITDAMREAAPDDLSLRPGYFLGALAAVMRRASPIVAPQAWDVAHPGRAASVGTYEPLEVDEMPYIASPIVEAVREEMPDLVMAADRGGRVIGLAVHSVWHRRYPGAPFPTIDSKLHFGRLTSKLEDEVSARLLSEILHRSGVMAEMAQRQAEGDERPLTIMLLDDWVAGGRTTDMVRRELEGLGLVMGRNLRFVLGTMLGTRIDEADRVDRHVVGDPVRYGGASWTDNEHLIGVDYGIHSSYDEESGTFTDRLVSERVRSRAARRPRKHLRRAVNQDIAPSPYPYPVARPRYTAPPRPRAETRRPPRPKSLVRDLFRRLVNAVF